MNNKKFLIKKVLIFFVLLFIISIVLTIGLITINGVKYLDNKYREHFTLISIKLPYYSNDADFFDLPKLYKKGELIPFTLYFSDDNNDFTVIYKNGEYYDDYQLEDIHQYATEYFNKKLNTNKIQSVLFYNYPFDYPCYNYYYPLKDYLTQNNKLWTRENIDELVRILLNDYDGEMTIFINNSFNDLTLLPNEKEKFSTALNEELFNSSNTHRIDKINICFANYSLPTQRIYTKNVSYSLRFDYYDFKSKQKNIDYNEIHEKTLRENGIIIL